MSLEAINAVLEHSKAKGSARLVLVILAHHGNKDQGHKSWPCVGTIAKEANIAERQVQRILRALGGKLKELHISFETGISRTNEYWPLLPGLPRPAMLKGGGTGDTLQPANDRSTDVPTSVQQPFVAPASEVLAIASPCQALAKPMPSPSKGDTGGAEGVTCRAAGGDGHDTQTQKETEKKNSNIPLNPPKGEGEESDFDFWMKLLTEFKGLPLENATTREWKALKKHPALPAREQGKALLRYLRAACPEAHDKSEEADLLRSRKRKLSTLLRHLPEMCANAMRYDKLVHPEKYRPKPPPPPPAPTWDWLALAIDMYASCDPPYDGRNAEMRARLEQMPWEELDSTVRREILKEYRRNQEGKKEAAAAEGQA